jgi:hypothetical protein
LADCGTTWEYLISHSVILNSLSTSRLQRPIFHPLLLKHHLSELCLGKCPLRDLRSLWMSFFQALPSVRKSTTRWDCLEVVHIYFECLRRSLLASDTHRVMRRLTDYYEGQEFYQCGAGDGAPRMDPARNHLFQYEALNPKQLEVGHRALYEGARDSNLRPAGERRNLFVLEATQRRLLGSSRATWVR